MHVNISWQIPEDAACSTGISFVVYYERNGSLQQLPEVAADSSWVTVDTDILGSGTFRFLVKVTVDSETAKSSWSNQIDISFPEDKQESSSGVVVLVIFAVLLVVGVAVASPIVIYVVRYRKKVETPPRPQSVPGLHYENADKIPITMVTSHSFNANSRNPYPEYYCYLNSPDADALVTARRVRSTRGNDPGGISNNPAPPSPQLISDSSHPAGSAVYKVSLSFNNNDRSYAFGTFSCEASKTGRKFTTVSNILMNSDVLSRPADGLVTQTVNTGDTGVEIRMSLSSGRSVRRWWRNGVTVQLPPPNSPASEGTLSINNFVQKTTDEGFYEAVTDFMNFARRQPKHGLQRLIIRSCRAGRWRPPGCTGICDECYNGGVCDDETGKCICPPGFMGTNCLTACGGNRFGFSCEFQCSYDGDDKDSCSGLQFCLLDPFGCRCNTGWKGLGCDTVCSEGTFGASCLQECNCDGFCDRFTGVCNGTCEAGWRGGSCQMECSGGYFGKDCLQECRCTSHACNIVTGDCSGQCKPQWVDAYRCLAGLENVTSSKANPNGTSEVMCVTQVYWDSSSTLTVYLSRQPDHLESRGIEFMEKISNTSTEMWIFTADNVREGDELYCLVFDQRNIIVAMLHTTVIEYDLPVFNSTSPALVTATATSITIRWRAWDPDRDDGDPPIVAYIPYYRSNTSSEWINGTAVSPEEMLEFMADNLEADTEYIFSVAVVREGVNGEGPRGPSANLRTKCNGVRPYSVMAYVNTTAEHVNISWQIPQVGDIMCSSGISFLTIYSQKDGTGEEPQFLAKVGSDETWITVDIKDLEEGDFLFFVSLTSDEESALSEGSTSITIMQPINGGGIDVYILIIIGVCMLVIVTLFAVILVFLRMKKKKGDIIEGANPTYNAHYNNGVTYETVNDYITTPPNRDATVKHSADNEESQTISKAITDDADVVAEEGAKDETKESEIVYGNLHTPQKVKVSGLRDYINCNLQEGRLGQEFLLLKAGKQYPWTVAEKKENKKKNRFRNMYTYDHSRVVLESLPGDEHSNYYNASYIKDDSDRNIFIAAQGPNTASLNDFWRMVLSEGVTTIVMVTNLIEKGKDRCLQYWPDDVGVSQAFGDIVVSLEQCTCFADYVIRKLHVVLHDNHGIIYQLHYVSWPDMCTPKQPTPLIAFVKQAKLIHKEKETPMVVHCSAGVGRTGTFIALYCLLDNILNDEYVHVFDFVKKMRENRVNMVQTGEQYVFLYKCLMEASLTNDTEMTRDDISKVAVDLDQTRPKKEFKLLKQLEEDDMVYSSYLNEAGCKTPSSMNQQYYNLSNFTSINFLKSFKKENAYITCAYPKPETIDQFWELVYNWECSVIVMLDQLNTEKVPYWPISDSTKHGKYLVSCKETEKESDFILHQFEVSQDEAEVIVPVYHLQLTSWPARDNVSGLDGIMRKVISLQTDQMMDGPVIVHCLDGEGLSGSFVAVSSEIERLQLTGKTDMFKTVRQLRETNTNVLGLEEDYLLCYKLLLQYLEGPHMYQNM